MLAEPEPETEPTPEAKKRGNKPGSNPPGLAAGQQTLLTDDRQQAICAALSNNQTLNTAAALAGVKVATVRTWIEKGAADDAVEPYATFHMKIMQAMAIGEGNLVKTVTAAAERDPKIALAMLEKRYRDDWGRTEKIDHTVNNGKPVVIQLTWPGGGDADSEIGPVDARPQPELEGSDDIVDADVVDDGDEG